MITPALQIRVLSLDDSLFQISRHLLTAIGFHSPYSIMIGAKNLQIPHRCLSTLRVGDDVLILNGMSRTTLPLGQGSYILASSLITMVNSALDRCGDIARLRGRGSLRDCIARLLLTLLRGAFT